MNIKIGASFKYNDYILKIKKLVSDTLSNIVLCNIVENEVHNNISKKLKLYTSLVNHLVQSYHK